MEASQDPPGPPRPALRRTILLCTAVPLVALAAWVLSRPPDLTYELELLRMDGKPPASPLVFAPGERLSARVLCRNRVHLSVFRVDAAGTVTRNKFTLLTFSDIDVEDFTIL